MARAFALDSLSLGRPELRRRALLIPALLFVSLLAENIHGFLTRQAGYESYAPVTVSELVRGGMFLFFIAYSLAHLEDGLSRLALAALGVLVTLTAAQGLFMTASAGSILSTFSRGSRWIFLFFALAYFAGEVRRLHLPSETLITWLRWGIVLFFSVPILLAALGLAGYQTYQENRGGFAGFIFNNNVIASIFVFTSPFYFMRTRGWRDIGLLAVFVLGAVLLGSKAVYGGLAVVGGITLALAIIRLLRRDRSRAIPLLGLGLVATLVIATGVFFSPFGEKVAAIFERQVAIYNYLLSGQYLGVQASALDVLSSFRTARVTQLFDWAADPSNTSQLLFGGGVRTFDLLYGEINWIDLIALYGLLGTLLLYSVLGWFALSLWHNVSIPWRRQAGSCVVLAVAFSLVAGHTFDNPAATFLLAAAMAPACCWWTADPVDVTEQTGLPGSDLAPDGGALA